MPWIVGTQIGIMCLFCVVASASPSMWTAGTANPRRVKGQAEQHFKTSTKHQVGAIAARTNDTVRHLLPDLLSRVTKPLYP